MPQLAWSQTLSVGVREIDAQHKRLIELLDRLLEGMREGGGQVILGEVLDGLIDYTKPHFADEERLMTTYVYPNFAQHHAAHLDLTNQVLTLQAQYHAGEPVLTPLVAKFPIEWLYQHIGEADLKVGLYLNSKGVR
jgi:hemerythrin